jgi:hypothetical protein
MEIIGQCPSDRELSAGVRLAQNRQQLHPRVGGLAGEELACGLFALRLRDVGIAQDLCQLRDVVLEWLSAGEDGY